jgi:hypothetical protein
MQKQLFQQLSPFITFFTVEQHWTNLPVSADKAIIIIKLIPKFSSKSEKLCVGRVL